MKYFRKFLLVISYYCLANYSEALPQLSADDIIKQLMELSFVDDVENGTKALECKINIQKDFSNPQPLILHPGTTKIYNPLSTGELIVPYHEQIEFNCHKSFIEPFNNKKKVTAQCIGQNRFVVTGKIYNSKNFVCSSWFSSVARKTGKTCYDRKAVEVEVGFQLTSDKRFVRIYDLCHDEKNGSTLYVHHNLTLVSNSFQHGVQRIGFKKGNFYGKLNVDNLYKQKTQKETVGLILGGNHEHYFDEKASLFLARGHMCAKADQIYANEQRATFYFVNAAPQWQIFNAGNWQTMEDDVRRYVQKKKLSLECYTGSWGVGTLADSNGNHKPLYLHHDGNASKIPVPKIYYRVIIDFATRKGIVLIGVNNPHLSLAEIKRDYILCNDVSKQINWISWKKDNIRLGYSYACDVKEFMKVVGHLQNLDVRGLLV